MHCHGYFVGRCAADWPHGLPIVSWPPLTHPESAAPPALSCCCSVCLSCVNAAVHPPISLSLFLSPASLTATCTPCLRPQLLNVPLRSFLVVNMLLTAVLYKSLLGCV